VAVLVVRAAAVAASLLATLSATTAAEAAGRRYVSASVDGSGNLRIVDSGKRATLVKKERDQVGFDQIRIAKGGRAIGWLALFPNCCTSYPIPLALVVESGGRRHRFTGIGVPVFQWRFMNGGSRVAFQQETVHGGFSIHYEMRDVGSGRRLAQWEPTYGSDNRVEAEQHPPPWVKEFNAATGIAPWQ
jgi:hypothetical protein